jgi:hypothetical protein
MEESELETTFKSLSKEVKSESVVLKLIEDEADESVVVNRDSYLQLYKLIGGLTLTLLTFLFAFT